MWNFHQERTIRGEVEEPIAVEIELGWVLSGPLKGREAGSEDEVSVNLIGVAGSTKGATVLSGVLHEQPHSLS